MRTAKRRTCNATLKPRVSIRPTPSSQRPADHVKHDIAEVVEHRREQAHHEGEPHDDEGREDHVLGHGLTVRAASPTGPSVPHDSSVGQDHDPLGAHRVPAVTTYLSLSAACATCVQAETLGASVSF